jgi:hypothetical protein
MGSHLRQRGLARGQIGALTRIVMKTIILPSGNAFGVDDINGFTAYRVRKSLEEEDLMMN